MRIQFTIHGNHEDLRGNPIPKIKKTYWQRWSPEAKRYAAWKKYVQAAFLDAVALHHPELAQKVGQCIVHMGKPIELGTFQRAYMQLTIHWKNDAHADPENVFGSIADALFVNDKNLDGKFWSNKSPGNGSVEVDIGILDVNENNHGEN